MRVVVIGLDHWYTGIRIAGGLANHSEIDLVGIVDPDVSRAQQVAGQVGVANVGAAPEEFLDDDSVDVVASFTSCERNASICVAAAQAGKHILSVKPLARTLDQATEIVAAVRAAGVTFLGAESRGRYTSYQQQVRTWIAEGWFGRLLTASFTLWSRLPQGWPDMDGPGWFGDPERAPGGGWIDHGIYQLDQLRWLTGAEVVDVRGTIANLKYPDLAVEDYGLATVTFDNGLIARVEDSWTAPSDGGRTALSLVGTDGALSYDTVTGQLSLLGALHPFGGWVHTSPEVMRTDALDELVATVRGEREPIATVEDAWTNLAVCTAFYQAAALGRPVTPQKSLSLT